jgi:hypothetical protein
MASGSRIRSIRWALLPEGAGAATLGPGLRTAAVWPAPVDADACFAAAGFTDFEDSDAAWDADFREIARRLLDRLGRLGPAEVREGSKQIFVLERRGWLRRPRSRKVDLSLLDHLLAVTAGVEDDLPDLVVEFGRPPVAALRAGSGHPIFWLSWPAGAGPPLDVEALAADLAGSRPAIRTDIDWAHLVP